MALKVGSVINKKYEVLKVINTGGMSTVYIALDTVLNKNWAIKEIIKKESNKNKIEYKSLLTEINIMMGLDHVYLPRIVDMIEDDSRILVVMDYIEGKTLEDVVNAEERGLPQEKVIKWGKQLAVVLGYLHSREIPIIYRDMKPSNVMLQPNGNIKLFDFGASRKFKDESSWKTVQLGTKGYAAPERHGKNTPFDARSDIYELGMTLYHLITGHDPSKTPEQVKPVTQWNPSINKGIEKIINKMTELDPNDRYQSTAELLYDLDHYTELDSKYITKLTNKLRVVASLGLATVVFFTFSVVGFHANSVSIENKFEEKLEQADSAEDPAYAVEATAIKKDSLKPYELMVYLFKQDNSFSIVEEVQLLGTLNTNTKEIQSLEGYGDLAFRIGELYAYYSEDLDDATGKATKWFEVAKQNGTKYSSTINLYNQIAEEKKSISNDKKGYGNYVTLSLNLLETNKLDTKIELETIKSIVSTLEKSKKAVTNEGVSNGELKDAKGLLNKRLAYLSAPTEEMKKEVKSLKQRVKELNI